jgi:hypothetical protein
VEVPADARAAAHAEELRARWGRAAIVGRVARPSGAMLLFAPL